MTLALYGKSRRRQGVLVLLALFAVFAALIGGVAVQKQTDVQAQVSGATESVAGISDCANEADALADNGTRATCSGTQFIEVNVTPPAIPAQATDLSFRVALNGQHSGSGTSDNVSGTVLLSSNTKTPAAATFTWTNESDEPANFPGGTTATCGNWGTTWTAADLAGLKVRVARTGGTVNLSLDDVAVSVCYGARTITAATANTAASIVVAPSQGSINLAITAATTGAETGLPAESNDWFCSTYQVEGQVLTTFNNTDSTDSNTFTRTAVITAPAAAGTYDITMFAYSDAGCTARVSNTFTLPDALVVKANRSIKVQKVALSAANPGGTFDFTATNFATNPSGLSSTVTPGAILGSFSSSFTTALNDGGAITEPDNGSWSDTRWALVNNNSGSATCGSVGAWSSADTSADVPADGNDYVVCFRNTPPSFVDLTATKAASVASVTPGQTFTWTITITNTGNATAAFTNNEVILRDQLPGGATYANLDWSTGDSDFSCSINGSNLLQCNLDGTASFSINAGASVTVTVDATPAAPGSLTNPTGGACAVDPLDVEPETDATPGNNSCGPSTVTVAAPGAVQVFNDAQGVNDEPGQKDLTRMTVGSLSAGSLAITWNWDELGSSGANTLDACSLYDTDADGKANYSLCQTTTGNPATALATTLYSCNDANADRCNGNAAVSPFASTCTVGAGTDPFPGGDSHPADRQASCTVVLSDFVGAAAATLIDVCSYPSQQPNADPSDCVIAETGGATRTIRVMKVTPPGAHPLAAFSGTISPGGDTSFSVSLAANGTVSAPDDNTVSELAQTVTETTLPADWTNAGYFVQAASGQTLYTCTGAEAYSGASAAVAAGNDSYTVCVKNTYAAPIRSLRIMKVTDSALHPAQTFAGTLTPGPDTSFSVLLAQNAGASIAQSRTISAAAQIVTEAPVPSGWTQAGYAVVPDTVPPYLCTGNETYTNVGLSAPVPAGSGNYVVCIENIYNSPVVSIAKTNSDANAEIPAGSSFTWTITVNVAVNPTISPITVNDSVPGGFTITNVTAPDFGTCSFAGQALTNCVLPATAAVGPHTITVTVTAPADFPMANCTGYTNTATLSGTTGMTLAVANGETAAAGTATDLVTVIDCRDPKLALSKSSNEPSPLPGGGTFTWQIKAVVTDGPTVAAATIVDTLPAGFTFNGAQTFAGSQDASKLSCLAPVGQVVTCTLAAQAAGGDYFINIPVTAPAALTLSICTTHENRATASFPANQGMVTGSPATDSVTITCPDVSVAKSRTSAATVTPGTNNITYSIVVHNAGPGTAHNVQVSDDLPSNVTWVIDPAVPGCGFNGSGDLACTFATIAAGAANDVTITLKGTTASPASCGVINNTATVVGANDVTPGNNSDPAESVTVECPDASVVKTLTSPASIDSGDPITYSITVAAGPNGASQNVVLTDVLEETMSWTVSGSNLAGCNGPAFPTGGATLTCSIGTMAANTSRTYTLTAVTTAAQCGIVDNTASVASTVDVDSTDNSSTAADVTVKCPNVVLEKTTSTPGPLNAGDPISYTLTATNNGTGAAKDFFLVDNLPTSVTGWQIDPANAACAITGTQLRCPGTSPNTTTLAAGAQLSVTVTGMTTPNSCGSVVNTAHAEASNDGANGITDAAAPAITVNCPDITVLKDGNGPVNAGDQVIFTITVDNIGQGTAKTVALNDTLLAGQKWTLGGADAAACTLTAQDAPQSLSCSWTTLTGAETAKVITLSHPTGPASGLTCTPVQNTAGVTAGNESTTAAANLNSSTDSVSINCADIKVKKVADASPVSGTDNIGFVIKVWNTGAGEARGVQVTDTLPSNAGLNWAEDSADCTITGGVNLVCNFPNLPGGQSEANATTVHLTSPTTVATCGTVSNPTAQVTTSNDGSATDGENIVVNCPDVTVAKALYNTSNPVSAGDTIKFKITVTVTGAPGTVAKNVTLVEQLPQTTSDWSVESTTPNGVCAALASSLMCTLGNVTIPAGGGDVTFEIIIVGKAIGPNGEVTCSENIINAVRVRAGNESNTENNGASAPVAVNCPNIVVTKSASAASVTAGDPITFTITVKNTGGGTANNVVVEDDLPTGLTWTDNHANCSVTNHKLVCADGSFASIAPGDANAIAIQVTATTDPKNCAVLTNKAFASAGNDNLPGSEQVASNEVTVDLLCSDVSITKAPETGFEVIDLGQTIRYVLTVTAAAGGDAHGVAISDTLPLKDGLIWSELETECSVTAAADGVAQVLTCEFEEIAAADSESVTVTSNAVTASACGPIPNIASVSAGNEHPESVDEGNTSNEATVFVNCPDLEVIKTGSTINYGATPVFTITVENKGTGDAKNVVITDVFPTFGTWTITTSDDCEIDGDEVDCGTLGEDGKVTLTVTGSAANTCEPLVNSVSAVASNEVDPDQFENSDEATINVTCGTIQVVKVDRVGPDFPGRPSAWHFTVGRDGQPYVSPQVPSPQVAGSGSLKIENVPFGAYSVAEVESQGLVECPIPNPVQGAFRTLVDDAEQEVNAQNLNVTFTFTNEECGIIASTGFLEIHKVSDINANHAMDAGDTKLGGWPMTITGPEFPGGVVIETDSQGRILLPAIETGSYTVTEGSRAGYTTVGVVADDNAPVFSVANTATVDLAYSDTDVITFYNQPHGTIVVRKNAVIRHNGIESDSPADRDGWMMTISSAACGITQQAATNASGTATFSNLPMCSDYVVSESSVNAGSSNFNVVGSPTRSGVAPGLTVATEVTFTNERVTTTPPCPDCSPNPTTNQTGAPTPPPGPSATPTNTAVPTNTVGPSTPSPVATTAGERTPGPAQPTPIAPSTGEGIFGSAVGGTNLLLVLAGLAALAGGLAVVALGRRTGGR